VHLGDPLDVVVMEDGEPVVGRAPGDARPDVDQPMIS